MDQINWVLVFLVCNFGLSLFNSISNRHKVAQEDVTALRDRFEKETNELWAELNKQGRALSAVEAIVDGHPDHDDLAKIYEEIRNVSKTVGDLSSNISNVTGKLTAVGDQLGRMDTFWRNQGNH